MYKNISKEMKRYNYLIGEMEDRIFASWRKEEVEKYLELTERFLVCLKENIAEL